MELVVVLIVILLTVGMFVGVVAVFVVLFTLSGKKRKQRTEEIQQFALRHGFQFFGQEAPPMPDSFNAFRLAQRGRRHRKHNLFSGSYLGYTISYFDYYYITGSSKNTESHWQSVVMILSINPYLPNFTMTPEGFGARLSEALGGQDIDFTNAPEFSKSFQLKGRDEPAVQRLFTPSVLNYFASNPGVCVEGEGSIMVLYRDNYMEPVDDLYHFLEQGVQIANLLSG